MAFQFATGPGQFTPDDLDTVFIKYRLEGTQRFFPDSFISINGFYTPNGSACALPGEIRLRKSVTDPLDPFDRQARVAEYRLFAGLDSFMLDSIEVTVIRDATDPCRCITEIEREFNLNGVQHIQRTLDSRVITLKKK